MDEQNIETQKLEHEDIEFQPLTIDLEAYETRIALEAKVKELAQAKVQAIETVYEEAFDESFESFLLGLQPVIPSDDESLEVMAVKAYHQFKLEQQRANKEFKRGVFTVSLYGMVSALSVGCILMLIFRLPISRSFAIGLLTSPISAPLLALKNS